MAEPEPKQRTIGVTSQEKARLEAAKKQYEKFTGNQTDWGNFLGIMTVAGLVTLGLYKMVKSSKSNPIATCTECGETFSIAYSENLPPLVYVKCPNCSVELVVDMTEKQNLPK